MSTPLYTQEQLDIALLKQESGTLTQTLSRIENEMISGFEKVEKDLREQRRELFAYIKGLYTICIAGFVSLFGLIAHKFRWF